MPTPDPIPPRRDTIKRRFLRIFVLLLALSIVVAAASIRAVTGGENPPSIHFVIAVALGTGLTVLLGTSLMTLVFLSAQGGHDEPPHIHEEKEDE
jgi:peptidoglycan/LPS O-acetylase OafA/YrhL